MIISTFVLCVFINLNYVLTDTASGAGVRVAISETALAKIEDQVIPYFISEKNLNLSDVNIKQHVDFIGTIKLDMTNNILNIPKIKPEQISFKFLEDRINISLINLSGQIGFDYTFHSGFYDSKGNGTVLLSEIVIYSSCMLTSQPSETEPGKLSPGIDVKTINFDSAKMQITFSNMGKMEKLIQYFVTNVQNAFIALLKNKLSTEIMNINIGMNKNLAKLPLNYNIPNTNMTVDYTMSESPQILQNNLELSLNISLVDKINHYKFDGPANPIPHIDYKTDAIETNINQYVFEAVFYILYKENKLNFFVNSDNYTILTTKTIGIAIPQLYEHYKESKNVDLNLVPNDYPKIIFNFNETGVDIDYTTDFIVRVDETTKETALTLDIDIYLNTTVLMDNNKVHLTIKELKIKNLKVVNSAIGDIKPEDITYNLNSLLNSFKKIVESSVNTLLEKIKIPEIGGISFNKTSLVSQDGYLHAKTEPEIVNKHTFNFLEMI